MRVITTEQFSPMLLAWARKQFEEEVHSDFQRTQRYDGSQAKEHLKILCQQSPKQLAILARVLPLGVFWETPDALKRRSRLTLEERGAVEKLRADYNSERRQNFQQRCKELWRARDPDMQKLFKETAKDGKRIHQQVGKQQNLEVATAGLGEWGLIAHRDWGRIVISINLGRSMSLSYHIGIYSTLGKSIRFHDHYLKVLGIGAGNWSVENRNELSEKFLKAFDFAIWHIGQYEAIVKHICYEPLSVSTP